MIERRRTFLVGLGAALVTPRPAFAQQKDKLVRIGWLGNSSDDSPQARAIRDAFRSELQRRGWIEGRNLVIDFRFADGVADRFLVLAREMVELKVDLILASSGRAAAAAKQSTDTIPVVFASVVAPDKTGLVASLARPGGNLTGLASLTDELIGKRLQLLKEAFPAIARVAVLGAVDQDRSWQAERAAAALGLQSLSVTAQRADELAAAFAAGAHADAWFVQDTATFFANRRTIVDLVAKQRKPAIYPYIVYVEDGGLMSYAIDQRDQFRRAAELVDRILRGAKPADLPVEQPTKFDLVINMKTAKALGITISQAVLLRADEVIE